MNASENEEKPVAEIPVVQIPSRKLRESAVLPSPSPKVKETLETTGQLPAGAYRYQMADVLALAIQSGASDLHLRVGEPPVYRVDGKLIRAEGPPIEAEEAFDLLRAFSTDESIQTARDIGQADFGLAFEQHRFRVNIFRAQGLWGAVLRRIPQKMPQLEDLYFKNEYIDAASSRAWVSTLPFTFCLLL